MQSVSVIIRCYNEEKHLGRLLSGIRDQSVDNIEIIVVDSGSSDASPSIAEHYGARVLHIPMAEFSFGRSLNLGCQIAHGDILVAVSAHCYPVYGDWLEHLVAPFSDPKVAMAYGMQRGNGSNHFSEHRIFHQWFGDESNFIQSTPFANNANSAFRRDVWKQVPFNETLTGLEDLDFAQRLMRKGHRIAYVAEATVIHVHEETWAQIYNRYRREAMAMRRILPHERFGLLDFLRLFTSSIALDLRQAARTDCLLRELGGIIRFRWCQYFGTYRGYHQRNEADEALRQTFYYPNRLRGSRSAIQKQDGRRLIDYTKVSEPAVAATTITLIDISTSLDAPIPVWPGDPSPQIEQLMSLESGDHATVSTLHLCVHTGTHIDAPSHFISKGDTVGDITLDRMIGSVYVAAFKGTCIDVADLVAAAIPDHCKRLLLRTSNSALWGQGGGFKEDFVALTPAAAQWLVDHGIGLVGIDYLSIERYQEPGNRTHQILLGAGVVVIEGLDLSQAAPGEYELICLPMRLDRAEGAPARVVLRRKEQHG